VPARWLDEDDFALLRAPVRRFSALGGNMRIALVLAAASLLALASVGPVSANTTCNPHPKHPEGQCAKALGGTCTFKAEIKGGKWVWWTTNPAYFDCLKKKGGQ
jgi:hypothetical protein